MQLSCSRHLDRGPLRTSRHHKFNACSCFIPQSRAVGTLLGLALGIGSDYAAKKQG